MAEKSRPDIAIAGVMGWPIGHSLSPLLHNFWLKQYGLHGAYVPLPVHPARLQTALRALPALGFRGVNLTLPLKTEAIAYVDEVTQEAQTIGAINMVTVGADDRLLGANSDGFGFLAHLDAQQPGWDACTRKVAVLGAGGAARAVLGALRSRAISRLVLLNRNLARAEALATELGGADLTIHSLAKAEEVLTGCDLLINTTSLGMAGQPPLTLDLTPLPDRAIVYDIVYRPLRTGLLQQAKARGLATVDGLGMLIYQAVPAFAEWFGHYPQVTSAIQDPLLLALGESGEAR